MPDPSTPSVRLQAAIADACDREQQWQAKIAAGIHAALEFAASNPEAAREVAAEAEADGVGDGETVERLREMLAEVVPAEASADAGATTVRGLVTVIAGHVRRDREDQLAEIAPDLICLALLPYIGFEEAKRWAV